MDKVTKINKAILGICLLGYRILHSILFSYVLVLITNNKWFYLSIPIFFVYDDILSKFEKLNNPMGDFEKFMEKLK